MSEAALHVDREHPWLGLAAFPEDAQEFFHGRESEVAELHRRVKRQALTVLFSQSGLGKTSLLQAGLFPRLRADGCLPVYIRLDFTAGAPALPAQARTQLAGALAAAEIAQAPGDEESLWEFFHRRDTAGRALMPVLVFDQFEELFTLGRGAGAAGALFGELGDLVENRVPAALEARFEEDDELIEQFDFARTDYRVLLSLREDYLPHLEALHLQIPSLMTNRLRLARMSGGAAVESVIKAGGHLVERDVAEAIVRFVAGAPAEAGADALEIEPSLLSLVCRELNNKRIAVGQPCITADLLAGSSDAIIQDFYERCLADQPDAVRSFVEDELLTDSGFRENIAIERARRLLEQRGAPAEALDALVNRRLLRVEERFGVRRVELTHDILTGVARASRETRRQREEKVRAEALQREAEEQRHAAEVRERKTRRDLRRARSVAASFVVLFIAAAGVTWWALQQRAEAQRANRKAQEATTAAEQSAGAAAASEASFRRALYASQISRVYGALSTNQIGVAERLLAGLKPADDQQPDRRRWEWYLLKGFSDSGSRSLVHNLAGKVNGIAFTSQGQRVVTVGSDGVIGSWDAATGLVDNYIEKQNRFVGIGVRRFWEEKSRRLRIDAIIPGGPAERDGRLHMDDVITRIWGEGKWIEVETLESAAIDALFKGEAGTALKMEAVSPEDPKPREVEVVREEVLSEGHSEYVGHVVSSADGDWLATGGGDRTIRIWDARTLQLRRTIPPLPKEIWRLAISPDGSTLASVEGTDPLIRLWSVETGEPLGVLDTGKSTVWAITFHRDGRLISGSYDGTVMFWDAKAQSRVGEVKTTGTIYSLAVSADGRFLAAGLWRRVRRWRLDTDDAKPELLGDVDGLHVNDVLSVAFSPSGKSLASGSTDGVVKVWSAEGKLVHELKGHTGNVPGLVFHPDGQVLATAGRDGTARLWNLRTVGASAYRSIDDFTGDEVAFSPDGRWLVCASVTKGITVHDTYSETNTTIDAAANNLAFRPRTRQFVTGDIEGTLHLLDLDKRDSRRSWKPAHTGRVNGVAVSPDGKSAASTGNDGRVLFWELDSAEPPRELHAHNAAGFRVAFSSDGKWLASYGGTEVRLWDLAAGKVDRTFWSDGGDVLAFSPDASMLLYSESQGIIHLAVLAEKTDRTLRGHAGRIHGAAFNADGTRVFTVGSDRTLRVWDLTTDSELFSLTTDSNFNVAISPDGYRLAAVGNSAIVYDVPVLAAVNPPESAAFFVVRARLRARQMLWEQASADLLRAIELGGDDPAVLALLADYYGEVNRYTDALAVVERATAAGMDNDWDRFGYRGTLCHLALGDVDAWRAGCAKWFARLGQTIDPSVVNHTAWMLCLHAGSGQPIEQLVAPLRTAIEQADARLAATKQRTYNERSTLGTLLYRTGRYREAITELNAAIAALPDSPSKGAHMETGGEGTLYDWLFLAMAHQQLGEHDKARWWYDKSVAAMNPTEAAETRANVAIYNWTGRLELLLFRKEAEELLGLGAK